MLLSAALATACLFSCTPQDPDDPGKDSKDVTVSISADATFNAENKANVTLTLSGAASADVVVKLAKADIQSGKTQVPADFDKKVTIKAGETSAKVTVTADVLGLEGGEYQSAIKIDTADGAKVADNAVVYINLTFEYLPDVNLYADGNFSSDCTAKISAAIGKASSKDVVVKLAKDASSTAKFTCPESITIPAGQTSAEAVVTVDVAGVAAGTYPAVIKIAEVQNGKAGSASSVSIKLVYPFSTTIYIDGEFADWEGANEWKTPEDAEFTAIRTIKLAANAQYMYAYIEINEPQPDDFNLFPMPVDLFIDCDANVATGGKLTSTDNYNTTLPYTDSGLNWYIEKGNIHDGQGYIDFSGGGNYHYIGADGGAIWSLENLSPTTEQVFAIGVLGEDGIGRIEIQFLRSYYGLVNTQASFGIKLMNGNDNWNCWGLAPIGGKNGGSASQRVDMAVINMPVYAE